MNAFLKALSFIFHPLFVPLAGTFLYYRITPKYSSLETQAGIIFPIFILTVIIPIIFYSILYHLGQVKSIFIYDIKERKYFTYIYIALLFILIYKVIPINHVPELYFYFVGLIGAALSSVLLLFLRVRASLYLMGVGSIFMYLICLSIHFEKNIIIALSISALSIGLVASSRLYYKAHTKPELLIGLIIGVIFQLLTIRFWL